LYTPGSNGGIWSAGRYHKPLLYNRFYQKAMFFDNHQLNQHLLQDQLPDPVSFNIAGKPFDFPELIDGSQSFAGKIGK
jgi:hypothetical protein